MDLLKPVRYLSYGATLGAGIGFFAGMHHMDNYRGSYFDISGLVPLLSSTMCLGIGAVAGVACGVLEEIVKGCCLDKKQIHQEQEVVVENHMKIS